MPAGEAKRGHRLRAEPDWPAVHRELKRKHVTLQIVWDEYIAAHPGGYSYSRFCELYRGFEKTLSPTMRQTHAAGERLFVDYAGDGVPVVIDRLTGEVRMAQIFVAVLAASSFTFAHASWTQTLPDWIAAHVRALAAIGGVPQLIVPDNTKTAVVKACLYDPQVNRTYADMAARYGGAILPARPRKPRDKSKVEQAVLIVERWLIGRLRHRTFHSLAEVNAAIGDLMTGLNDIRPIRRLGVTRRRLLEEVDRPALKPLPTEPYEYAEWKKCRVGVDYHVEVAFHYYSVPHRFLRAEVEARLTARTVEVFLRGERIAAHPRGASNRKHTTLSEHMPSSHRRYAGWTIERIRADAQRIGSATAALCERILNPAPIPSRASGRASGSSGCRGTTARSASRRRPGAPSRSAPGPTARSNPSSTITSIGVPPQRGPRTRRRSCTPTSVGRATTTNRKDALLKHPTLDQLHALGLHGMAKAFDEITASGEADNLGPVEWLGLLLDREASWRQDKRFAARLRVAKLRQQACVEDIDYRTPRGLDRALFQKLIEGGWIDAHDNLALIGPTGVGKSWLASALGHKACRDNRSVLYQRLPRLFEELALARGDGRHARLVRSLGRADLLILDDWGLEPLDAAARHDLLEILEERYGRRATVITSQLPVDRWHGVIGDSTLS